MKITYKKFRMRYLTLLIAILLMMFNTVSCSLDSESEANNSDNGRDNTPSISNSEKGITDKENTVGQQEGPAESNEVQPVEKNGFDSASNEVYELAGYIVEIPTYWQSENLIDGGILRYSETNGKVAMLQVTASEESDDDYPVTFDALMDDNENMIEAIESTAFSEVTSYEVVDTGVIKGILYKGTIEDQSSGLAGYGEWFTFPSEIDRNWCTLVLCQTENTEYSYIDDFMKIIQSIKPIEETSGAAENHPETPTEPVIEATPEPAENLTAENCPDLAALLALRDPGDPSVAAFASKHYGQVIEFDGCVNSIQNHGDYTSRWDVLIASGDYDENSVMGPNFHLTNVNFNDMNVTGGDSVYSGLNVRVVAEVGNYDSNSQLLELQIISIHVRD